MNFITQSIKDYKFKSSDQLLLDTNIWLFIYGPQKPGNEQVAAYSEGLSRILKVGSRIHIDVLVVSEFINAYARLKWKLLKPDIKDFKIFRRSTDFKPIALAIAADIKRVLGHCLRVENGFEMLAIDDLIKEYEEGDSDFNDQILVALCKRKSLMLVTDDGDFSGQNISILTANKRLLA